MTMTQPQLHPSRVPNLPLTMLDESSRVQVRGMLDDYLREGRSLMSPQARATRAADDLSYPQFDNPGSDPRFEAWGIREHVWLTGFVFLHEFADALEVRELYVSPSWRHRRLASRAVDEVKALAQRRRLNRVIARVFRTNRPAVAFWESPGAGFAYVSSDTRYGLDTYSWPQGLTPAGSRGYWQ